MFKTRIFLTGADSFTGSHILAQLLSHDSVSARLVVKSAEAAHVIWRQCQTHASSFLDAVTIADSDLLVPGVFDEALQDLSNPFSAIVHNLNVIPSDEADCLATYIRLETDAVIGFLKSVRDFAPAVTRVVIVTSLLPFARWLGDPHIDSIAVGAIGGHSRSSSVDSEHMLATSQASSNVVSDAVIAWTKQSGAHFDVAIVTAPSVYGPTVHPLENSSDLTETNRRLWNIFSNEPLGQTVSPLYGINHFSDVRDVADAAVRALFIERASNMRLVVSAGTMPSVSEIAEIIVAKFPELQSRVGIDGSPHRHEQCNDMPPDFLDTYLMATILGVTNLRSAEVTVTDTVRQMLDLQQRKAWRSITQN
ncbi:hypothetical protein DE146DRAFT_334599 [Phaeosphaeria sp. MPI-PUGE-AT-0046c]|nr:hypothetical protein DE146DRAFT_334599 [Phaeosphaeria sp. MPI-PUGE-AT-0046c]